MSVCITTDFEENQIHDARLVRARKVHKCGECGDAIKPGDLYEYVRGLTDDCWWTAKTCARCCNVRADYFHTWIYGWMVEQFRDVHGVDYREGIPAHITPCARPSEGE